MKKIFEHIKPQIPKEISGYSCIKTQEVWIPHLEIGIECLIRNISEISLFFETILRLVEIEVKSITEISYLLGVSEDITKEAVVDMVSGDYIGVSENNLWITKKGKDALASKKVVTTKKKNLTKILINLITGEIFDGSEMQLWAGNRSAVCLAEIINVNKQFLDANYSQINSVFQTQQENDSAYGSQGITKELYKIVNISYRNLVFAKNQVFFYRSRTSDEFRIEFASDKGDKYLNCLYSQLKNIIPPCLENLFERNRDFIDKASSRQLTIDQSLVFATKRAKEDLESRDNIADVDISLFTARRYSIIEKEYVTYFDCSDELAFSRLIIYTNRVASILNIRIAHEIERISQQKPVVILYDKNEYYANESIKYFFGRTKSKNLNIYPSENVNNTIICFEGSLIIEIEEQIIGAFGKTLSFLSSIVNFDRDARLDYTEKLK